MKFTNENRRPSNIEDAESRKLSEPAVLLILALCVLLVSQGIRIYGDDPQAGLVAVAWGGFGMVYAGVLSRWIRPITASIENWRGLITVAHGFLMGFCLSTLSPDIHVIPLSILVLVSALLVTIWERRYAYLFLSASALTGLQTFSEPRGLFEWITFYASFFFLAVIISETIYRFAQVSARRIERLETLNKFISQIGVSLEAGQVINLVNAALAQAIEADTYFLGIQEGDALRLGLFYDDGEYFNDSIGHIKGTLSGWVLQNREPLFIPDLRDDPQLDGVDLIIVGQNRASLSWMGVPMVTARLNGVLVVASYRPNAFDRTDMELLENLAHQAALALDNAYHHSEVERQSRLDSLTQVYNHGYFIKVMEQDAELAKAHSASMSLLMIDIDYFKQYNDSYGHLVGDQVLTRLAGVLKEHIHANDPVGRWGGEEFVILLPNTNREQAIEIARRIRQYVNSLSIDGPGGKTLPFPTISQGIAVYPEETENVIELVDIADKRLYVAKERGRNQIETG